MKSSSVNQGMRFGGCNSMTCGMLNCCCPGMNAFKLPIPNSLPFVDCSSQYGLANPDHFELRAEAAFESALLSLVQPRESDVVLKKAICGSPISQQEAMCAIIGQRYHDAQIAGYIREIVQEHRVNRYAKLATSNACRSRVSNHFWA